MKQGRLAKTSNVIKAEKAIEYLLNRPKMEMVGLGLIYGHPGLGKTTFAMRTAVVNDYIYIRMESYMTPKTFAIMLAKAVHRHLGHGDVPVSGHSHNIFRHIVGMLIENPDIVIMIDEIDYAFQNKRILGAIRDIVDQTLAAVILIGMQDAKDKLYRIDRHYFDRCNVFVEFKNPTKQDIALFLATVMEVEITKEVVDYVYRQNNGTLRDTVKLVSMMETVARAKGLKKVGLKDLGL